MALGKATLGKCSACAFPDDGEHATPTDCMAAWRARATKIASFLLKQPKAVGAARLVSDLEDKLSAFCSMLFLLAKRNGSKLRFDATELNAMANAGYRHHISFDEEKNEVSLEVIRVSLPTLAGRA